MFRKHAFALTLVAIVAVSAVVFFGLDLHSAGVAALPFIGADAANFAKLEQELGKLAVDLTKAADDVKKKAEETQTEMKNLGKLTEETKKSADQALIKHNEIDARVKEIEQLLVKRNAEPQRVKSIGEQFTENEDVQAFMKKRPSKGSAGMKLKAIISALTTDADGSAGDLIVPQRLPGIVAPPQRRFTIRALLSQGRTSSNSVQYVRETGFTNLAATVSETSGAAKPETLIKFDIATANVATIAHWVRATKQILDDVPMLQSYIDGRLRYGLEFVEELQLLLGDNTGTNLNGIYTQATAYSAPLVPTAAGVLTKIDVIRLAILQVFLAEYPANGIAINPIDWADIELTKTDTGAYLFANPQGGSEPRLWRLPVVETQAMTVDKFLTGAFNLGARILDREDANVEISTEDADNFTKNLVTIRAEERLALVVDRPESFVKGDFSDALSA